jgi:type IV pilus assembly protein PilA
MREKRVGGDHGFTLIELLVVVVIIGVLVAIAIPVYMNYRKGAENKSAQSDIRSAITAIEQCYTEAGNSYPADFTVGPAASATVACGSGAAQTVNTSAGNTLTYTNNGSGKYTITAVNSDTSKTFTYHNDGNGQIS